MHGPTIIINFKTYLSSTGENAVKLAKICEKVAIETHTDIRVAVVATDIHDVAEAVSIPVYAEHVDSYLPGAHTGSILPEHVKVAGASGTLINHSEHPMALEHVAETIKRASQAHLATVVCAATPDFAEEAAKLKPDFVAVEPPELIGGDISVSTAHPEIISQSVERVKNKHGVKLLVGAGIKTREDVIKALELGADGVLIASGVDKADDPEKALRDLIP
ncbi:MAG: triose-phosphate isomerase [Nanoarchaeota archaeon]|nr:triose-phosphate isomerase [Nanoarchaeota archaeon]MBU1321323.1 triose-phosphate isomerase [Nanoarchaeota archaeon]MBU1597530.1 triose-phosphate isomerase [Nanoarchaeota archaeon]MBU2441129.1 triose-phosphate isomerase [Nanoarchaeota archaeon]